MLDLLFQVVGLVLLLAGVGLGYWRWVAPYGATLDYGQRGVLLLPATRKRTRRCPIRPLADK